MQPHIILYSLFLLVCNTISYEMILFYTTLCVFFRFNIAFIIPKKSMSILKKQFYIVFIPSVSDGDICVIDNRTYCNNIDKTDNESWPDKVLYENLSQLNIHPPYNMVNVDNKDY